ncbi:MAG: peroxiredoxin [Candidatus Micrarchaeota archaeon]|nr:peroxiredoxin [Candidatus Micrarchaeota archaeon]
MQTTALYESSKLYKDSSRKEYGGDVLKEGSAAPDFTLMGSDGKEHRLSDFRGREVVLYFYPRDDTPGCTIEAKEFNRSLSDIEKRGAIVIGVSSDGLESHQRFRKKYSLEFLLLSDPVSKVIKLYNAYGDKGIFGMGTLRKTFIIDKKGRISKIFERVRPLGHSGEVLSCLS